MEFFHKVTRFPFMSTRKVWYGLSALLIVASIGLVVLRGLNLGVDFTGGVVVDTNFPQAPNIESLRATLAKAGVTNAQVQAVGSSRDIRVRLPPDRRAHPGGLRHRAKRRKAAEHGSGRSAGGPGTVRQGRLGAVRHAGVDPDLRAVPLHAQVGMRRDSGRVARSHLRDRVLRAPPDDL